MDSAVPSRTSTRFAKQAITKQQKPNADLVTALAEADPEELAHTRISIESMRAYARRIKESYIHVTDEIAAACTTVLEKTIELLGADQNKHAPAHGTAGVGIRNNGLA